MGIVNTIVGKVVDRATNNVSDKTAWLLVAVIGIVMFVLAGQGADEGALDEVTLTNLSDEELQQELDRRTKGK